MKSVPYDQRSGGSPASDAIRNLIQQDAIKKQAAGRQFQDMVAQHNSEQMQPFQDEQTPHSLMQQTEQMQQMPQQPAQMAPGQLSAAPAPAPTNPQQGPANPQLGPSNPGSVPPESTHVGGARFSKGRRYVG